MPYHYHLVMQMRCKWLSVCGCLDIVYSLWLSFWTHCFTVTLWGVSTGNRWIANTKYQAIWKVCPCHGVIMMTSSILSVLLAICAGISPVTGEFPAQRPVTRSFHFFFNLRPNKRLSKQSRGWRFETPSHSLWRQCNDAVPYQIIAPSYRCLNEMADIWQTTSSNNFGSNVLEVGSNDNKSVACCQTCDYTLL